MDKVVNDSMLVSSIKSPNVTRLIIWYIIKGVVYIKKVTVLVPVYFKILPN